MATKQEIASENDAIIAALSETEDGLVIEEIAAQSNIGLNRRTMQRRLKTLVDSGRVTASGAGRARLYHLARLNGEAQEKKEPEQGDMFVPVSKIGGKILRKVTKPLGSRDAKAYDRELLESYRPNVTHYLTTRERKRLKELGQAQGTVQAAGTYALQIMNRLLIDLSWNSSRLEGSTYSLLETQRLIELGQSVDDKEPRDAQMILNHKAAIEFLVRNAEDVGFNQMTILNLHALLAENLLDDSGAAGRLRRDPVAIRDSTYMLPEVPQLIEECFNTILATASEIRDPFEQAFFIMVHIPYLQPFIDVNKRVSRLAMNIPLIKNNLAPLSFIAVPDSTYVYGLMGIYEFRQIELLKDVFIWAYEKSASRYVAIRQTLGDPDPFKLRYRSDIRRLVAHVIVEEMDQIAAANHIANWSKENIEADDRSQFIEVTETELLSLHEGNFARYQVRPSEFDSWQKVWRSK